MLCAMVLAADGVKARRQAESASQSSRKMCLETDGPDDTEQGRRGKRDGITVTDTYCGVTTTTGICGCDALAPEQREDARSPEA